MMENTPVNDIIIVTKTIKYRRCFLVKIIQQLSAFDYEEIEILGDLERVKLLIDNVPDETIIAKLEEIRGKGRNDYPIIPVWNSILIAPLIEATGIDSLRRELSRNRDLRKLCGFNDADYYYGKCKLVPPPKAYSNMFKNLKMIEPLLKDTFRKLVDFMYDNLENFGVETAGDGKIFQGYAKTKDTKLTEFDARSETDADWTFKDHYYKDSKGVTKVKRTRFFGFRIHLLSDANYELPIEYVVTSASKSEAKITEQMILGMQMAHLEKIKAMMLDKGYDDTDLIQLLKSKEINPIIDICNMWKDGETTKQYKDTDIIYTYDGKVSIVVSPTETVTLKYLGYDKVKNTLRYGYQDKVYSIDVSHDERVFTPVARNTKKWKRLYNKRTSIERINGRIDRDLGLENNHIRGLSKATVVVDLLMIAMLSMAKGHIKNKQHDKIRRLKS